MRPWLIPVCALALFPGCKGTEPATDMGPIGVTPADLGGPVPLKGGHLFSRRIGDDQSIPAIQALAVDSLGNVLLTGTFQGSVDFGGGPLQSAGAGSDLVVAKYAPSGHPLWSVHFGAQGMDSASCTGTGITVDHEGNVVVTGSFDGTVDLGGGPLVSAGKTDLFVARYAAADGKHLLSRRFGGNGAEEGGGIAVDGDGNLLLTGGFQGTVDLGGGPLASAGTTDRLLAKFAADLSLLWARRFGAPTAQSSGVILQAPAVDSGNNVVLTGAFAGTVDFGTGPLSASGSQDVFLAKLSSSGGPMWSMHYGGARNSVAQGVALDHGDILIAGWFSGSVDLGGGPLPSAGGLDIFLARFGADGHPMWQKSLGGPKDDVAQSLAVDRGGHVLVTGGFHNTVDFGGGPAGATIGENVFVAKYAGDGKYIWANRYGETAVNRGLHAGVDRDGSGWISGTYQGGIDLGGGRLAGADRPDNVFLLKIAP